MVGRLLSEVPAASWAAELSPAAILLLCVVAGVGTVLLLPGRREAPLRKIGAAILIAALLVFAALLLHAAASKLNIYFWIFSAIALVGSVRVITHLRPVYSALYFVLTVFATAGLFVLLSAEFMAAALVLIYAGAILVTYVFVIMLASSAQAPAGARPLAGLADYDGVSREPLVAAAVGFGLMAVLLFLIFDKARGLSPAAGPVASAQIPASPDSPTAGSTQALGQYLFANQLVNLELAGVILTVAMVGAIVIARRRVVGRDEAFEPTEETISANLTPQSDAPDSIAVYGVRNPRQKAYPEH